MCDIPLCTIKAHTVRYRLQLTQSRHTSINRSQKGYTTKQGRKDNDLFKLGSWFCNLVILADITGLFNISILCRTTGYDSNRNV
jgi:hypothetical protein